MAYKNNGTSRSLQIEVYKNLGGNPVQGYPKTYNGQESWGNPLYPALTDLEARRLSDAAFSARYIAFATYVSSIEGTLDFNTDITGPGPTKTDASCLVVATTTTTAAPEPTMRVDYVDAEGVNTNGIQDGAELQMLSSVGNTTRVYSASVSTANTGAADLIVTAIEFIVNEDSEFSKTVSGLPWTISTPFQNGFTVEFNADQSVDPGLYVAVLRITSNDPAYPEFEFELQITVA